MSKLCDTGSRDGGESITGSSVSEAWVYIVSPEYLAFKGNPVIFQAALKFHWLLGVDSVTCEFPEGGVGSYYILCAHG